MLDYRYQTFLTLAEEMNYTHAAKKLHITQPAVTQHIQFLQNENIIDFRKKNVLLTCAVDRFGLAEELVKIGARCTFGDFLFILGAPFPIKNLRAIRRLGAFILPIAMQQSKNGLTIMKSSLAIFF